ncbi:hypothetical protein GCM10027610_023220 [Dactylosporangium cerinum]
MTAAGCVGRSGRRTTECRAEPATDDPATALTPVQMDAAGRPDRDIDRARFLTAWRRCVLEDHGQRVGGAAVIAAGALPATVAAFDGSEVPR